MTRWRLDRSRTPTGLATARALPSQPPRRRQTLNALRSGAATEYVDRQSGSAIVGRVERERLGEWPQGPHRSRNGDCGQDLSVHTAGKRSCDHHTSGLTTWRSPAGAERRRIEPPLSNPGDRPVQRRVRRGPARCVDESAHSKHLTPRASDHVDGARELTVLRSEIVRITKSPCLIPLDRISRRPRSASPRKEVVCSSRIGRRFSTHGTAIVDEHYPHADQWFLGLTISYLCLYWRRWFGYGSRK